MSRRISIPAKEVRSLVWRGDTLVDWVAGGVTYGLDGLQNSARVLYGYRFDASVCSPDGNFVVIYERLGTKALLLKEGDIVRELGRSFYHADMFEASYCLWQAPSGRTLLAHCPEGYEMIEISDADTGEVLTPRSAAMREQTADFFHSRLEVSPGGRRLLSAGWVWHPFDAVVFFDIGRALEDAAHLDSLDDCIAAFRHAGMYEESSATWQTDSRIILGGNDEAPDPEKETTPGDTQGLGPHGLAVYDIAQSRCISSVRLEHPPGTLMAVGETHVLTLYEYPRLVRLADGVVVEAWTDIPSGLQVGSICGHLDPPPPMALDPRGRRFAIATEDSIEVVTISEV